MNRVGVLDASLSLATGRKFLNTFRCAVATLVLPYQTWSSRWESNPQGRSQRVLSAPRLPISPQLENWCAARDLNPHPLKDQFLRLACLPFHQQRNKLERKAGIEPALEHWQCPVLPLNYFRLVPLDGLEPSLAD